jgi:hypothetical protein
VDDSGSTREGCLLERRGRKVTIKKLAVGEMWRTGLSWDGSCWRIAGESFGSGELLLKTYVGERFELGGFSLERCR